MTNMQMVLLVLLGLVSGILSGLLGIGSGIILIPALVFLFGISQSMAQGTVLALLSIPVTFLTALTYYRAGNVNLTIVMLIAIGFIIGGPFGARLADLIPVALLSRAFGVLLIMVGIKMAAGA